MLHPLFLFALLAAPREAVVYESGVTAAAAIAAGLSAAWRVEAAAPAAAGVSGTYAEGAAALAAGRKAYDGMLFEEAVPQLRRAVERLAGGDLEPAQWPSLWSAYLWLALTHDALGDEARRDASLDELWRLDPDVEVAGAEFPPAFRERVRKRLTERPVKRARLRVESEPAGAEVYVNGRRRGATPLVVDGLPDGEHAVALLTAGRTSWHRRVTVHAGFGVGAEATPDLLEARLAPAAGAGASRILERLRVGAPIDEADRRAAAQELAAAGKHAAMFAVRDAGELRVLLVPLEGPVRGPVGVRDVGALAAQVTAWLAQGSVRTSTSSVRAVGPASDVGRLTSDARPTRWWLWTTVGAVVAAGATAPAVAASSDPAPVRRSGEAVVRW